MIHEIISKKRQAVAEREKIAPLAMFHDKLVPSDRSLLSALRATRTGYILECKKASPSQGLIREDFDIVKIARDYAPMADAISVITDEPFFQGRLEFVTQVRDVVICPVLCKDFVVSTYQVFEARKYGADAILLMLSVLDDAMYADCFRTAHELSMDVLTEVHDEQELDRALALGAPIIGVNNRDFKTLGVDLNVSRKLIPKIPKDKVIVLESGIFKHSEVLEFRENVDAFLVGTSLMQQPKIDLATRKLVYGRVKVCGLTSEADAQQAYASGATFGGMIFAKESPRYVEEKIAQKIASTVPLQWVGVFVNEGIERVSNLAQSLGLFAIQLHGEEDLIYVESLRKLLSTQVEIWKAIRVKDQIPSRDAFGADRLLLDTFRSDRRGGTGETFDWSLLRGYHEMDRVILSGGVSPQNVAEADRLGAYMLDVNSQVEETPGKKSKAKLNELFAELRGRKI